MKIIPNRPIPKEHAIRADYQSDDMVYRRNVLRDTVKRLENADAMAHYQTKAWENLARWREKRSLNTHNDGRVQVIRGDWGQVTQQLTQQYGEIFAVLNMANAYVPGGGYLNGMIAQEENMFRRTDCHFSVVDEELDRSRRHYSPEMTALINAEQGAVYLDTEHPRICVRDKEIPAKPGKTPTGYEWLPLEQVFPFYELRAAAQDLRDGSAFDAELARKKIAAQLDTCISKGVRHVVLSAFGCGAFLNPPEAIAQLYKEELEKRKGHFDVIAFAVYYPGYGKDNFTPFNTILNQAELAEETPEKKVDAFYKWISTHPDYINLMNRIDNIEKRKNHLGQDRKLNDDKQTALRESQNKIAERTASPKEIYDLIKARETIINLSTSSKPRFFRGKVTSREPLYRLLHDIEQKLGLPQITLKLPTGFCGR